MRSSIAAQSCASVPPEPDWMSTKQLFGSSALENMRRNSMLAMSFSAARQVSGHADQRGIVGLGARHLEQFARIAQLAVEQQQVADDALQGLLFAAEFLRALGIAPDVRFFELSPDFDQACLLGVEVKDTSAFPWRGRRGR